MKWEESYIGKLRTVVGSQKLIVPSIRAIIEDHDGKVLFIGRLGEGKWSMPSGSIELNESIYECLVREVKEETGLDVISAKGYGCLFYIKGRFSKETISLLLLNKRELLHNSLYYERVREWNKGVSVQQLFFALKR